MHVGPDLPPVRPGLERAAELHSSGAYLVSLANAAAHDGCDATEAEGWTEAAADVCIRTGWAAEDVRPDKPPQQKAVSVAIDEAHVRELLRAFPLFDRARLLSESGPGAGA